MTDSSARRLWRVYAARPRYTLAAVAALGVARLVAECSGLHWSIAGLVALAFPLLAAGLAIAYASRRALSYAWPGAFLLPYVLWPQPAPALGAALLLASATALLVANGPAWMRRESALLRHAWPEALVGVASFALYASTAAPTVLPGDAGEFQLVASVLGIAHPPGYPLYTMLAHLWSRLPLGELAYRVNLFAAVCSAATVALTMRIVRSAAGSVWGGLIAALALALGPTFWVQSTTANIRSFSALLTAACLLWAFRWDRTRRRRDLACLAVVYGLAVGHHLSLALLGPSLAAYVIMRDHRVTRRPGVIALLLGAFLTSLCVLLYLPLRSAMHPAFDPSPIRTLRDLLTHITGSGFQGDMVYFRTWEELLARTGVWLNTLRIQFGVPLLLLIGSGFSFSVRRQPASAVLLASAVALNSLAVMTYRAPQTVEYLIPSYVCLALLLGQGIGALERVSASVRAAGYLLAVAISISLLSALHVGARAYASMVPLHRDRSEEHYALTVLQGAPESSLILANWHHATPLWYLQTIRGLRPDVEIRYVYPQGATPNERVWLNAIQSGLPSRPVVVTNWFYAFGQTEYRWSPLGEAWLVHTEPLRQQPAMTEELGYECDGRIRILGYILERPTAMPGDELVVSVVWQPMRRLDDDYSTFVQLLGPTGVIGQEDRVQPTRTYEAGEVRVDTYRFPLLLQTLPGDYRLVTGFYTRVGDGWRRLPTPEGDLVTLTTLAVAPARQTIATTNATWRQWDDGLRWIGYDVDRSVAGETRVYLHWQAAPGPAGLQQRTLASTIVLLDGQTILGRTFVPTLATGERATTAMDLSGYAETLSLARVPEDGPPVHRLGVWGVASDRHDHLALGHRPAVYIPLGGRIALVGLRRYSMIGSDSDRWVITPRFLALRPLLADVTVSVGLRSAGWERKDDGTPALGAIPTLKWQGGWLVNDPHTLNLAGAPTVLPATITIELYDAFTLRPLAVLDDRRASRGQGTQIVWEEVRLP